MATRPRKNFGIQRITASNHEKKPEESHHRKAAVKTSNVLYAVVFVDVLPERPPEIRYETIFCFNAASFFILRFFVLKSAYPVLWV
jgi:hypothetical protein